MNPRITITALMIGSVAAALPATAQTACGPRDQLIAKLEDSYGENRLGAGLRGNASVFEIWASADSGSWTILVTGTDGVSCVMASGEYWQEMPVIAADIGAPA